MKLLKSKGVVGLLAVVAIGFVAKNVILPLLDLKGGKGRSADVPESTQSEISPVPVVSETINSVSLTVLEGVNWSLDSRRDPFKDVNSIKDLVVPDKKKSEPARPIKRVFIDKDLTLEGIMIEPGKRFAVINDEIVTEGDDYKDYQVIRINENLVRLKGLNGYQNLTLTGKMFEEINKNDETNE